MRVFYIDEDDNNSKITYYVKVENVDVPESLKGFKAIDASDTNELLQKIKEYYGFVSTNIDIQLWSSSNFQGKRLDLDGKIPKENEFIWVRVLLNR